MHNLQKLQLASIARWSLAELGGEKAKAASQAFLEIRKLEVRLPGGAWLFRGLDLEVCSGEVVAVVGGSGAGKTTLIRALFEPEQLAREGWVVKSEQLTANVPLGLVPQRGAPFDHLDVAGNIKLALRHADPRQPDDTPEVEKWLTRVDLPGEWAGDKRPVAWLSGGQAQRLAVARTLAGGRKLIFLDEPSVGLDPYRVQLLAKQLRILSDGGTAIVLITHDVALATAVSNRILFLDGDKGLRDLAGGEWPGPLAGLAEAEAVRLKNNLQKKFIAALTERESEADAELPVSRSRVIQVIGGILEPLGVATVAVEQTAAAIGNAQDYLRIFWKTLRLAVVGPLLFFAVASVLLGFTVLFAIIHVTPEGLAPVTVVREIGGSYVTALSPALSAVLFVAASGNAVNAWLGSMSLTRQIAALEALGIRRERYLWAPIWTGLTVSYLAIAVLFAFGLLMGGVLLCAFEHIPEGWTLLSTDLLDPRPSQVRFVIRALWLVFLYGVGIASDVVSKGSREKASSEAVTRGMTSSVVACTLWVVALELVSALWLYSATGGGAH